MEKKSDLGRWRHTILMFHTYMLFVYMPYLCCGILPTSALSSCLICTVVLYRDSSVSIFTVVYQHCLVETV